MHASISVGRWNSTEVGKGAEARGHGGWEQGAALGCGVGGQVGPGHQRDTDFSIKVWPGEEVLEQH